MHDEIEQAGLDHEHGPDVGTHAGPESWHVVHVSDADAVPMPLRFDTLEQALTSTSRTPGPLRIAGGQRRRARVGGHDHAVKRVVQGPSHYEVELRHPDPGDGRTGATWRAVRRGGPDGSMQPLRFGRLAVARTHADRLSPKAARVVAVERGGWRRAVDIAET